MGSSVGCIDGGKVVSVCIGCIVGADVVRFRVGVPGGAITAVGPAVSAAVNGSNVGIPALGSRGGAAVKMGPGAVAGESIAGGFEKSLMPKGERVAKPPRSLPSHDLAPRR